MILSVNYLLLFSFSEAEGAKKYPLVAVRGLLLPSSIPAKYVEDTIDFKPQDTDIFVVTYPKCGTTWAQYIVWEILHKGVPPPTPNKMMVREFPFLEFVGTNIPDDMPPPRTLKTHLPFHLQPYNPKSKYIYVVRNPWDCCVSYYHHLQFDTTMPPLTFDEHFELFIRGEVPWGDFFDHALSWFEHRNDPNVLFLTYEDMKKDKRKSLLKIAKFLGESYHNDLKDDEIMENCLKHTDFKYMKELGMFMPNIAKEDMEHLDFAAFVRKFGELDPSKANPEEIRQVNFFRKGEVGDWKNHFSPDQIKKFNEYMSRKLKNTEMENFWKLQPEETSL